MDLHNAWQKLNQQAPVPATPSKDEIMQAVYQDSKHPLAQLKHRLFKKMMWIMVFLALAVLLMVTYKESAYRLWLIGIFAAYYALALVVMLFQYRKLQNSEVSFSANLRTALEAYYRKVDNMLKFEEYWGMSFIPVAIILGMLFGGTFGSLDSYEKVLNQPSVIIKMMALIAVLTPLAHWLAKRMNRYAFGAYLEQLQQNINALKE